MNFTDFWATNDQGEQFVFTVEMQRALSTAGLPVDPSSLAELDHQPTNGVHSNHDHTLVKHHSNGENGHHRAHHNGNGDHSAEETVEFEEPTAIQIDPSTGKYLGRVKWFNFSKGYGFIARGGNEQIFFHKTDLLCKPNDLDQGTWVLYDVEETDKGFEASDVEISEAVA